MASSTATGYDTRPPPGLTREQVAADVPALLPLLDACPDMHIYTAASSPHYAELAWTLAPPPRSSSSSMSEAFDEAAGRDRALVRPTSEAEAAAAVRACAAAGLPLAVRNGGFDPGARSRTDAAGGIGLDVRSLAHVDVAADGRTARLGGGVVLGALLARLDRAGLDTPVGWGARIGYAGWAAAGGYGMAVASRGLGCDQIVGARVVTAGGAVVVVVSEDDADADADDHADVLWALRGAGAGALGVVTELTVRVYPRPRLAAGQMLFPRAEAAAVFAGLEAVYRDEDADGRDKFCAEAIVFDAFSNGGTLLVYFWYEVAQDDDDEAAVAADLVRARALHDRIAALGTLLTDTVVDADGKLNETTPYKFLQAVDLAPLKPTRQYFRNLSLTTPPLSAALGAVLAARPQPTPSSCVVLHVCRGAGTRGPAGGAGEAATAFAHRTPHVVVSIAGIADWDDAGARAAADAWAPALYADVVAAGLATGWKYANFNPREKGDGRLYLGAEGVARLRRVKARYDPGNLFARSTPDLEE